MTIRIRIVGVGSPSGDDRLGWIAAGGLRRSPALSGIAPQTLAIVALDRPGTGLLEDLGDLAALIVIDAVRTGAAAGTLHRLCGSEIVHASGWVSSHGFGIAEVLALGQVLGCLPPQVIVFGLEMADAGGGVEMLSAPVAAAMPVLIEAVEREVFGQIGGLVGTAKAPCKQ